eukprot:TRINITY_DN21065_c0_g1_i1.p1 TRINITY_DN21065_c0_g1~~TRINITY_DN21065_c0_g1_i1.p1  ORF type:complete len:305 (+),score=53.94 TRINITY_DN21065_c0_g1_i1:50-916(+)
MFRFVTAVAVFGLSQVAGEIPPKKGGLVDTIHRAQEWVVALDDAAARVGEKSIVSAMEAIESDADAKQSQAINYYMREQAALHNKQHDLRKAFADTAVGLKATEIAERSLESAEIYRITADVEASHKKELSNAARIVEKAANECTTFLQKHEEATDSICPSLESAQHCYSHLVEGIAVAKVIHPNSYPASPPSWKQLCVNSWGCSPRMCWCTQVENRIPGFCLFFRYAAVIVLLAIFVVGTIVLFEYARRQKQRNEDLQYQLAKSPLLTSDEDTLSHHSIGLTRYGAT